MSALAEPLAWPTELPQHLSATQLSKFASCPEAFRRRYIKGEKTPTGAALVLGSAVGKTIEQHCLAKIHHATPDAVDDVFGQALHDKCESEGDQLVWGDANYNDTQQQGLALVRSWEKTIAPTINPVAVEHRVELRIPGLAVPIIGFVDIVERERSIEVKTAARKPNYGEPKPDWIIQGWVYRAALGLPHEWHCGLKTKTPAWLTPADENATGLRVDWSEQQRRLAERIIGVRAQQIHAAYVMYGPDAAWPGMMEHESYSSSVCRWCAYKPSCAWWDAL